METKRKPTTKVPPKTKGFPDAYIRLRTVLDALELNALQYCLEDECPATRKLRAEEIEAWVKPVIKKIMRKVAAPGEGAGCQDGYHNCGGVCVPYQCPESSQ
jgi:hypothetical protein